MRLVPVALCLAVCCNLLTPATAAEFLRSPPAGDLDLHVVITSRDIGESAAPAEGMVIALDLADRRSIERQGDIARVWRLMVFAQPLDDAVDGRKVAARWAQFAFDCRARTSQRLGAVDLAEDGAVLRQTVAEQRPRSMVYKIAQYAPAGAEVMLAAFACEGRDNYPAERRFTTVAEALQQAKATPAPDHRR